MLPPLSRSMGCTNCEWSRFRFYIQRRVLLFPVILATLGMRALGTARIEQASVPLQVMHREQGWDGCGPWRGPAQLYPCLLHPCYHLLPRLRCSATGLQRVSLTGGALQASSEPHPQLQCAVCSVTASQGMLDTVELCWATIMITGLTDQLMPWPTQSTPCALALNLSCLSCSHLCAHPMPLL